MPGSQSPSYFSPQSERSFWFWLVGIGLLALGLRLVPLVANWQQPNVFFNSDSHGYHWLAVNLLAGHGYCWEEQPPYLANVYRPPGYPLVLAALYALTGPKVQGAILLQVLAGAATAFLTGFWVRLLLRDPRLALTAAAVLAVDPISIYYDNMLLTEAFTALFVVLCLILGTLYLQSARPGLLLAAGAVLALGIMFHPLLLLAPFVLLALPLVTKVTRQWRHLGLASLAVVLALAPAVGWTWRNYLVADFAGISCVSSVNLLKYKAAGVLAELNGTSREIERDRLTQQIEETLPDGVTRGRRWRAWQEQGVAILRQHPGVYAWVHFKGMLVELLAPDRSHFLRFVYSNPEMEAGGGTAWAQFALRAVLALQGLLLLLQAMGLGRLLFRPWLMLGVLFPVCYVLLMTGGPEASPRFRVISMPCLSLCAALGWQLVRRWIDRFAWRSPRETINPQVCSPVLTRPGLPPRQRLTIP